MTITVKVSEAKTRLFELLEEVEAGQDVVIKRGNEAVARMTRIASRTDVSATISAIKLFPKPASETTVRDILEWRDEGRA